MLHRRRRVITGAVLGGLSLPRQGLLFYARYPNSESAVWNEGAVWGENAAWLYYALPVSCYAAVGTGFWFSDANTPIPRTMEEILADTGTNQYHIVANANKGIAGYDPLTVSHGTIQKAYKFLKTSYVDAPPSNGRIAYIKESDTTTDIDGLSVDDYLSVDATVRDIFFADATTLRATEAAYDLARVSQYLNMGTMVGRGEEGIALYSSDVDQIILNMGCWYFSTIFGEEYYAIDLDGKSVFGTPDIGAYEY